MAAQTFDFINTDKSRMALEKYVGFTFPIIWKDSAGTPINLTGYFAHLQVRTNPSRQIVIDLTTNNGGIVLDALNGKMTIIVSQALASDPLLVPGFYRYDLVLTPPAGGQPVRLVEGQWEIVDGVTQP